MIIGVGTDIVEINRIEKVIERTPSFLNKAFTEREIELFKSKNMRVETIAGNFAAKEAISKALGTGFRKCGLKDFEILRDELGKPIVNISEDICNGCKVHLSISHEKNNAIAFVVLEE